MHAVTHAVCIRFVFVLQNNEFKKMDLKKSSEGYKNNWTQQNEGFPFSNNKYHCLFLILHVNYLFSCRLFEIVLTYLYIGFSS